MTYSAEFDRPQCFGSGQHDQDDPDCVSCDHEHRCEREGGSTASSSYVPSSRLRRNRYRRRAQTEDTFDDNVDYDDGPLVGKHETATARFFKDGLAGGLRGVFYQWYRFWSKYRIK